MKCHAIRQLAGRCRGWGLVPVGSAVLGALLLLTASTLQGCSGLAPGALPMDWRDTVGLEPGYDWRSGVHGWGRVPRLAAATRRRGCHVPMQFRVMVLLHVPNGSTPLRAVGTLALAALLVLHQGRECARDDVAVQATCNPCVGMPKSDQAPRHSLPGRCRCCNVFLKVGARPMPLLHTAPGTSKCPGGASARRRARRSCLTTGSRWAEVEGAGLGEEGGAKLSKHKAP